MSRNSYELEKVLLIKISLKKEITHRCRIESKGDFFMVIMGIDPGLAESGYGIIHKNNTYCSVLKYGVIKTSSRLSAPVRLKMLYQDFYKLMHEYKPDSVAIEELFFNRNAKTVIAVGQARGVAILTAALLDIHVFEYTPLQVKQAVVGYGRADKTQVQQMIKILLNLNVIPKPNDAADALAVALCHLNSLKLGRIIEKEL
jgi:crossover junction endodeoxyribonuclease RuvC